VTLNANLEGDGIVVLELVIAVGFGAVGVSVAKPENFWLRWNHITSAEMSAHRVPAQPVDATQALNLSAGVSNCRVSRGRSLS
jgi:hypothetical protein